MADRRPAETFSVAEFIRDELEARSWTVKDLAVAMHRPEHRVAHLVDGQERITPQTAAWLAAAFTTSAELWLNLDAASPEGSDGAALGRGKP